MSETQERFELLDDVGDNFKGNENIEFKFFLLVAGCVVLALLVLLPKIYIKNKIYYNSRDINKLYREYTSLKEENRNLRQKVESMKFKNQILDTIF
jgi:cell division protein FtsL